MQNISINDIISTIKDKKRKILLSTADDDNFTLALKSKKNWTEEEYKRFFTEYSKIYLKNNPIDYMLIRKIKNEYNFLLTIEDYFNVIDELDSIEKQKEYINHYIGYYGEDITEEFYLKLIQKEYYKFINKENKVLFLKNKITVINPNEWVLKYFSETEIKESFKDKTFFIKLCSEDKIDDPKNIESVIYFYNKYEKFMSKKTKFNMLLEVVKKGNFELIDFLIEKKKVKILSKKVLIWHVCSDTARGNVFNVLNHLYNSGIKFTKFNLKEVKNHYQWHYMENTNLLLLFFKNLQSEKEYKKLNKKFKNKNITKSNVVKI